MITTMKCDVPHLGTHWFNPESITNIISLAGMAKQFKVTYDSTNELLAFMVHVNNDKVIKFHQMDNNLYDIVPLKNGNKDEIDLFKEKDGIKNKIDTLQLLEIVDENEMLHSANQVERAKKARMLYHSLDNPAINGMKAITHMNLI